MRYGIVFKSRWNEDPLTVFKVRDTDNYQHREPVDPRNVGAAWGKAPVTNVREFESVNLETNRPRLAYVVSRP